jgi:hypothetical protein
VPKLKDDIITGERHKGWIDIIGKFGDPGRTAIVNPIVAFVADAFAGSPITSRTLAPRNLIQQALAKNEPVLRRATLAPEGLTSSLEAWHGKTDNLAEQFPHLHKAIVWDLGCGEGYLGRWLTAQGCTYVGVEASEELFETKCEPSATDKLSYFEGTITEFLKSKPSKNVKPTLITSIGVLDGLADPSRAMKELSTFLQTTGWTDVPLLITTFDPDYFMSGLPRERKQTTTVRVFSEADPMSLLDPADWEQLFSECDFHVVDQRPIHLNSLPPLFVEHVLKRWRTEISAQSKVVDRIPPRQGPFYFWIVVPRLRRPVAPGLHKKLTAQSKLKARLTSHFVSYEPGEAIELQANLGSKVYELVGGGADFTYARSLPYPFKSGDLFGQMEINTNYFASRILGSITAQGNVCAQIFPIKEVAKLTNSKDFISSLFLSMISHLDSVSFKSLINSKHVSTKEPSNALKKDPMTSVRNCAAVLLNSCAIRSALNPADYKARFLVTLTHEDFQNAIFHDARARRRSGRLKETLESFVQNNLIDCFSARLLKNFKRVAKSSDADMGDKKNASKIVRASEEVGGVQQNIFDVYDDVLASDHYLHLGLIAARFIERAVGQAGDFDLKLVAFGISAWLGSEADKENFNDALRSLKISQVATLVQIRATLIKCILDGAGSDAVGTLALNLTKFIDALRKDFALSSKEGEKTYEATLSKFIIIRDIWALLACVVDDGAIWQSNKDRDAMKEYILNPEQEHRLIAYFTECFGRIAADCKLSGST